MSLAHSMNELRVGRHLVSHVREVALFAAPQPVKFCIAHAPYRACLLNDRTPTMSRRHIGGKM